MAFEDACLVALLLVSLSCAHVSFPQGKTAGPRSSGYGRNLNSLFAKDNTPYPRAPYDNPPYTSYDSHEGIARGPFTFSDANPSRHLSRPIYRHGDDDDQRFLPMKSTDDRSYYRMKDHPRNYYPNGDDGDKWGYRMKDDHQKDYLMDHDDHQKDYAMKDHDDHWSYGRKDDRHNYRMNSNDYTYYYGINHHTTRPDGLKDDHRYVMDHDDDHSRRDDHQKYYRMKDHEDHSRVYGVKDDHHQKYDGMNRRPDGMNDDDKRKYGGMKDHGDRRGPYLSKEVAVQKGTKGNSGGTSFVNYATVTVDYGRTEGRQDGSYGVGLSRLK